MTEDFTYNGFGELKTQVVAHASTPLLDGQYEPTLSGAGRLRDKLGRLDARVEKLFAIPAKTFEYKYDAAGRLEEVWTDGTKTEQYGYVPGRRSRQSAWKAGGATVSATYDEQDRPAFPQSAPTFGGTLLTLYSGFD